jgi:RNA methyltransferase, TrmH family
MLSKAKSKFIKSLQIKKYRKQEQCFVVQGAKSVQELIESDFQTLTVVGTVDFLNRLKDLHNIEVIECTENELKSLGEFQSNDSGLALAKMKQNKPAKVSGEDWALALDDIRDPGNLGTIIRTADWYGIKHIIASEETADFYNAKVISATMGSFTRINIFYTSLEEYLQDFKGRIYGAFLDGRDVHREAFDGGGIILIGNESRGIAAELDKFVTDRITIPRFGKAESLNAAIATAIICDNIRRR